MILALYAPAIFLDGTIQKTLLSTFFLCWMLWLLRGDPAEGRRGRWFGAGAALGAMVLTRENAVPLAGAVVAWLGLQGRVARSRRVALGGLFLAGLLAALLPVGVRNAVVGGEFHLTTSQFGANLYMGNNENATGVYSPIGRRGHPTDDRWDATAGAERALGRELTPSEVSAYWIDRAMDFIVSHPVAWLALLAKKAVLLANAVEIADTEDQYTYADASWVLRGLGAVFHFGVLAPLAVFGACATWRHRRSQGLLALLAGTYAATVILFFVFGRYRLPLVPILALFAGAAVVEAPRFRRDGPARRIAVAAGLTVTALLFSNLSIVRLDGMKFQTHLNLGAAFRKDGRLDDAIHQYELAGVLAPRNPIVPYNRANALFDRGRFQAAILYYRRALDLAPDVVEFHNNLAMALKEIGDIDAAVARYEQALDLSPDYAPAHYNLARALEERGDLEGALGHFQATAQLLPGSFESLTAIGWLLATHPSRDLRDPERAVRLGRRAAEMTQHQRPEVLDMLAAAYASAGRFDEATRAAARAVELATAQGQRDLGAKIRERLARYERGHPTIAPLRGGR